MRVGVTVGTAPSCRAECGAAFEQSAALDGGLSSILPRMPRRNLGKISGPETYFRYYAGLHPTANAAFGVLVPCSECSSAETGRALSYAARVGSKPGMQRWILARMRLPSVGKLLRPPESRSHMGHTFGT